MIHLKSIVAKKVFPREPFPFTLPIVRSLDCLEFVSPVTYFVGENGSGKSTLLEAIACAAGAIAVGSDG